jgi:2-polyprenyl-3-methyl-5-hydroxy-6-metoxy-1,4-benzoquinol methylase
MHVQNRRVVDAACGSGYGTALLALVAREVVGYDISAVAIAYAQEHFARTNVSYHVQDLALLREQAEVLVSFETTEHIPSLQAWESAVTRSLLPGGTFIFSVPLNESPGDNPYHYHVFTVEQAQKLFPELTPHSAFIQQGVNFYPLQQVRETRAKYLAYIGIMKKREV